MCPALDSPVHHHIYPTAHCIDDFSQLIECGARAIQLPTAVIGQDDSTAADVESVFGVGQRHDPFDAKLAVPQRDHFSNVIPAYRSVQHLGKIAPDRKCSAVHMNVFGLNPVVVFGTKEQCRRMLPGIVDGREKACFAVTEPNTGLNTTQLKTRAIRQGDRYVVNGQKVWISTAQVAEKILLLARTTPLEEVKSPTRGLSLFYTDFDRKRIAVHEIEKMGRKPVDSNELFFENFEIPLQDRLGEEGRGFEYILHGMNPERILIAAEAVGLGQLALSRASAYAKTRNVFNRPIGKNQAIQHPLAKSWMELEAAWLMTLSAAWQYDNDMPCGPAANAAKYLAAEAGFHACEQAVMTHGGFGYAKEFHVERYLRESLIPRIAPVSRELIMSFIAEKVLGQPKSY